MGLVLDGPFQEVFRRVGAAHAPALARHGGFGGEAPDRLAVLPWHREAVAARRLFAMAAGADSDLRGPARELPALAEAEGVAGPAVHLALAYGLGARDAEDRLATVDALLVLAARGQLDTDVLGDELGTLVDIGPVKPNRLVNALRSAADTGAYRTAWAVLRPVLPVVLAGESPHRGAGELLEVAADCVERCGASGTVAGLDAASVGSTRRAREARRLHAALCGAGA